MSAPVETGDEPLLLTPGPLTTSATVKAAMLHDLGSRDDRFMTLDAEVRRRLLQIAGDGAGYVCVPLQGSGTFLVEAMLATLVGRRDHVLILANGAYGRRMAAICRSRGLRHSVLEDPEHRPSNVGNLRRGLDGDGTVTHVAVVHCETTSGVLNPLEAVAEIVRERGLRLLVDAMSSFGAIPLDAETLSVDALVASSNKCLEGVPGMGFCVVRRESLVAAEGNCDSLSLDLHDQWRYLEDTGQWRFTPPTHCLLALRQALREHEAEGGVRGRGAHYRRNLRILVDGMRELGFHTLVEDRWQAPVIVTFLAPGDPRFDFGEFHARLVRRGYAIYPGKITAAASFRIGCIGHIGAAEIRGALHAVRAVLEEMGVTDRAPAATAGGKPRSSTD